MKYEIVYTKNEELWKMEKIAESHGYKKTQECYWVQIFEDTNGNHIVMTREDGELLSNPCNRLEAMLKETASEEAQEAAEKTADPATMENIAYKSFSAFDGIIIHDIEYGTGFSFEDKIVFSYQVNGKTVGRIHKCTIYNNASGAAYFRFRGRREYLRDYLKF